MKDAVLSIIADLLGSKKFLATMASVLVWLIGKAGLDVPAETLLPILGALAAYVLAQGWADAGPKEGMKMAAKLRAKGFSDSSIPGSDPATDPQ